MNCPTGCGNTQIGHWSHKGCGKQVYLKGNGNLFCYTGCEDRLICDWRFACERHQGDYKKVDHMALIDALGAAIKSTKIFFDSKAESLAFLAGVQAKIVERSSKY